MKYRVNHAGKRYGFLVAIRDVGARNKNRLWECACDCGNIIIIKSADLGPSRGRKSCGCKNITIAEVTRTHGMSKHLAYGIWQAMKNRCFREKDSAYKNYGARGIKVCARWLAGFDLFWEDMGATYKAGLTLERRNNMKGYSKANCYWATYAQQGQNKRNNRMLVTPWGKLCLTEAARRTGVSTSTLRRRLKWGWGKELLFSKGDSSRQVAAYGSCKGK